MTSRKQIRTRRSTELALRQSDERYKSLAENGPHGIIVAIDDRLVYANPAAATLLRAKTPEELLGRSIWELVCEECREQVRERRNLMMETGTGVPAARVKVRSLDGTLLELEGVGGPIIYGGKRAIQNTFIDITERRRTEEALALSEERFRKLFEESPIGIAFLDQEREIFLTNQSYRDFVGYSQAEITELGPKGLLHPEDWEASMALSRKLRSGEIPLFHMEQRYVRKDGKVVWADTHITPVRDKDGRLAHTIGWVQDITEQKHAEQRLQSSREQLRALSSRLQSLREEEQTRIAREIHDHLGQLLTALKLELRSLERKLSGHREADLQSKLAKLASAKELADEMEISVQKIASELRPGVLDRLGLAAAIEAQTEAFQSRTGIQCRCIVPDMPVRLGQDLATAAFRIFQEILTNVARHANATRLDVRLSQRAGHLLLEVSDNGVGIQKSQIEHPKSLGLLGIRERVAMFGGEVRFDGLMQKGTTVRVQLPATV